MCAIEYLLHGEAGLLACSLKRRSVTHEIYRLLTFQTDFIVANRYI